MAQRTVAVQSTPPPCEDALPPEAEEFLGHLQSVRDCSPLTVRAYRGDFLQLSRYLKQQQLPVDFINLSSSTLYEWAAWLSERYAPATVRRRLDSLSALLRHLRNLGRIQVNPVATIPRPKRRRKIPDPPNPEEARRLLEACQTPG